uniref:Peptidase S1 domain-containing protein n=1 Tax=Anopheles farauti TaxID=69004 RepID=A0A182QWD9_9DIPT
MFQILFAHPKHTHTLTDWNTPCKVERMYFATIFKVCKMLYQLFWFLAACCTFIVNALWLCCNFASVGIPWLMLLLFLVCIGSKFVKLKSPADDVVLSMLSKNEKEQDGTEPLFWPIVNRGGAFDAPENSLVAINQCLAQKCQKILLDLSITSDGKAIVCHKSTLEKANINVPVNKLQSSFFDNFNIAEHHPLGQLFQPEKVLTFEKLLKLLESSEVTVFLLASHINSHMLDIVRETVAKSPIFTKRIIFCCSSPTAIYQVALRGGSASHKEGGVVFAVDKLVIHPNYDDDNLNFDVCMVRIVESFVEHENISILPLTTSNTIPSNEQGTVSGWGATMSDGESVPNLRATSVTILSTNACTRQTRSYVSTTESMFCAGNVGRSICVGDSGSPLVFDRRQIGIVSFIIKECGGTAPAIYTRISNRAVRDFIRQQISSTQQRVAFLKRGRSSLIH